MAIDTTSPRTDAAPATVGTPGRIGIGMVGYAFMGVAHSQGWRNARSFFDPALVPDLVAIGGRDAEAAGDMARRFDWQHVETDWRALVARPDVDLVDICTPGDTHAEIAIAALEAGKHVLCEKPLANTVAEARAMAEAAERAKARGIRSMVGFTYRRVPAIALARQLVQEGRVGEIRHVRAQYLQDWLVDPESPLTWRLQKDRAGSGALGDIGAHIIDLTHFVTGERITGVSAVTETFVRERPLPGAVHGLSAEAGTGRGEVTVDDAAIFLAPPHRRRARHLRGHPVRDRAQERDPAGDQRVARQHRVRLRGHERPPRPRRVGPGPRVRASPGSSSPRPRTPTSSAGGPRATGSATSTASPTRRPTSSARSPPGTDPEPSFADGLAVQEVLAAVEASAANGSRWTTTDGSGGG